MERRRLAHRASSQHQFARAYFVEAVVLDDGQPIIGKPTVANRICHNRDRWLLLDRGA